MNLAEEHLRLMGWVGISIFMTLAVNMTSSPTDGYCRRGVAAACADDKV